MPTDTLYDDLIEAPSAGANVASIMTTRRNRRICVYDRRSNITAVARDRFTAARVLDSHCWK